MALDTLSDEQLHALLHDAEIRLKAANQLIFQPPISLPTLPSDQSSKTALAPCVTTTAHGARVDPAYLIKTEERKLSNGIRIISDPITSKKTSKQEKSTLGPSWFNLPRTVLTPSLKRDIQLLRSRSVLDPHRHYKKDSNKAQIPEFSQVGTVIEGPTEFFSARLTNKERKRTFVEEVLEGERETGRFKGKYEEIQMRKSSGRKEHWKKVKAMRRKGGVGKG